MFLNCTRLGGPVQAPSLSFEPWCWRARRPRSGRSGMVAPEMTVFPFNSTLTVFPLTVISKWFHSPTALSAWVLGVAAARSSGEVRGSQPRRDLRPMACRFARPQGRVVHDSRELDLHLDRAVLVEVPVEPIVIVAHGRDHRDRQPARPARLRPPVPPVGVLPEQAHVFLVQTDRVLDGHDPPVV